MGDHAFNVDAVRAQFPALHQDVNGTPLVYLDNAASSQVPQCVIDALVKHYAEDRSNVHRAVHTLSQRATAGFDAGREQVARFLGASSSEEIVFTRGTTEAINLVADAWGRAHLKAGDEVVITAMEHHANIVPWQMVCERTGAVLRVIRMDDRGVLDMEHARSVIGSRTRMVSFVHISNALGTINPAHELIGLARSVGATVLVDGAQSAAHMPVDMQELGADLFVFSGHKVFGPNGIGVLWGRPEVLQSMPPYQGGGDMIRTVSFEKSTFQDAPYRFEAGTPNVADVIGLGAALDWVLNLDRAGALAHETDLLAYATALVSEIPGVKVIGTAPDKASVLSFVVDGAHPSDVGTLLDRYGVAVRTGHHCAQPIMDQFGVPATARASFALYNTRAEVEAFAEALRKTLTFLV